MGPSRHWFRSRSCKNLGKLDNSVGSALVSLFSAGHCHPLLLMALYAVIQVNIPSFPLMPWEGCGESRHFCINLEFYIDIHAHSTMMNGFMYGNIFEDEERFQRQAVFPKLLCQNAEDFSYSSTSFNRDAVKAGTGRRFLGGLLNDTSYCYTLEVSFYSYILGGTAAAVPYTEEACILLKSILLQHT
uniref:ATP/GTP binding protein like 4 n=1 Tax=Zosterops lateralis melanops TaxID=1220523 RepID=A0A8D2NL33_ZOSLA